MSVINKLIEFIKNIFHRQDEVKKLAEPETVNYEDTREEFIKSLKVTNNVKIRHVKIETLVCDGDGLGIKNDIRY